MSLGELHTPVGWISFSVLLSLVSYTILFTIWSFVPYFEVSIPIMRDDNIEIVNHFEHFNMSLRPNNASCQRYRLKIGKKSSVFVIIKSRPEESLQRLVIRRTYGVHFDGRLIFVIGRDTRSNIEQDVFEEHERFNDILRVDFLDIYYNLGLKSLAILRWISDYCPNESFYLQADSDALIYPSNVLSFVERFWTSKKRIYGLCWRNAPVLRKGQWLVPYSHFSYKRYPEYCSGAAYLMSGDVPRLLLNAFYQLAVQYSEDDCLSKNEIPCIINKTKQNGPNLLNDVSSQHIADSQTSNETFLPQRGQVQQPVFSRVINNLHRRSRNNKNVKKVTVTQNQTLPIYISVDDVYFTGILAERAGVMRVNHKAFYWKRQASSSGFQALFKSSVVDHHNPLASFEYKTPEDLTNAWFNYLMSKKDKLH